MSPIITAIANSLRNLLKYHKLKILLVFTSALFFTVLLFPYSDLSDYTTAQVSKLTRNQVFLSFEDMSIGLVPTPSVDLEKVQVETAQVPNLKIGALSVSPSIGALLSFKKGLAVKAKDFLKGSVNMTYKEGDSIKGKKVRKQFIEADFSKLELAEIENLFPLPVKLKGKASGEVDAEVDPSFSSQPKGTTQIKIKNFTIPAGSVETQLGPIPLPELKFSQVTMRGKLVASDFLIEEVLLGNGSDPINGKIKGKMSFKVRRTGAKVSPVFGAYNIKISLNITKEQEAQFFFLSALDQYKRATNKGSTFLFSVSASRFGVTPRMGNATSF